MAQRPFRPARRQLNAAMYQSVTRNIEVTVKPEYLADRSSPATGEYFWAYTIEITNRGTETVQLRTRHWRITDGMGRKQEVPGPRTSCFWRPPQRGGRH